MDKFGDFNLNWRLTADPFVAHRQMDLSLLFDIGPHESRCTVPPVNHNYNFLPEYGEKYMQFIISDRVVNCLFDAMERQDWFEYTFSSANMGKHFGTHKYKINADFFQKALPEIAKKYGFN